MSKELLNQLKVGDKVWVEMGVLHTIDQEGDVTFSRHSSLGHIGLLLNHENNFSLSNPNELTVRELCEWMKEKGYGDVHNPIMLFQDEGGYTDDEEVGFENIEQLTEMVRNPNAQRKEEIKKQIEELQKELNSL